MKDIVTRLCLALTLLSMLVLGLMAVGKIKSWIDAPPPFTITGLDDDHVVLTRGNVVYKLRKSRAAILFTPDMVGKSLPLQVNIGNVPNVLSVELGSSSSFVTVHLSATDYQEIYSIDSTTVQ